MDPEPEILIVGAGFSGIGAAAELLSRDIDSFLIVDDGEDFGGTWQWNRYPGVAAAITSESRQFCKARRPDWSRTYAPGRELAGYARDIAAELGLGARTRFGTKVTAASFDEAAGRWQVELDGGAEQLSVRYLIDATGVLSVPKAPDIPGLDSFAGRTVHTARWDAGIDLTAQRVGVIGTGASAVQLVPAIADDVLSLTVFQRTPIWVLPKADLPIPAAVAAALQRVPGVSSAARGLSQLFVELTFPAPAHYHRQLRIAKLFERVGRAFIAQQVRDPELREALTPRYGIGCKRPSFHNSYLSMYNRANVALETAAIEAIVPEGIRTADGRIHPLDVLVLATGFKVFSPGNFPKYPVSGRGGLDLEAYWAEHRYRAYQGVSVPDFPNFFLMFGPYGYNGSSYFNLIESQSHHIGRLLSHAADRGADLIEVDADAEARYFAEMLRRRSSQVFWQASCQAANSYYFDGHGDVPFRFGLTAETTWRSRHFPLEDYDFSRAGDRQPVSTP